MTPTEKFLASIKSAVRPDQRVWVDEWAEKNRVLPADTPEPGPYCTARTPYVIDIQRTMSPGSPWREGWWMKPVQIGGSVSGENMIATWICAAAGSIGVVFPTLDDAKQWELTRFEPMRANTAALSRRIRASGVKGADNTKLRKKYPGGVMRLMGANKPIKSTSMRYIKFEEPDDYPTNVGKQGSLIEQAKGRASNFGRRAKIFGDGTPTIDEASNIDAQFKRGDQRRWFMHCPCCGESQHLDFKQLKWPEGQPDEALYHCLHCGVGSNEADWKARNYATRAKGMTEAEAGAAGLAHWRATAVGEPAVASWHLNALAAPIGWRPWPFLAREWLAAQGDQEKLKVFFNNILGLPYKETAGTTISAEQLQQRAEQYELMTCPAGGLVCIAGVDTQDNRLAVTLRAWGRGEESWGLWHSEIYGDPSHPETWAKLRELLDSPIRHANGQVMRVDAAAIDAGGHHGEDVYAFCRDAQLRGKQWIAIRGAKAIDAPKIGRPKKIDFTWRGTEVPGGSMLRFVGTQAIKNLIDGRLKLAKPGGGYYHFPLGYQADYYRQMRSEKREWRRDNQGNKALWWIKGSERNEAWDCEVYSYAAFLHVMLGRHQEAVWAAREKLFGSVQQLDLLTAVPALPAQTSVPAEAESSTTEPDDEDINDNPPASAAASPPAPAQATLPVVKPAPPPLPPARPAPSSARRGFAKRW
ncbi:MAG: hypothetical protein RJA98_2572 [Pseudomonadota bacterium]|jgi:phage terminase large subunit GpA-like protein